jgi:DUF1680 family protein
VPVDAARAAGKPVPRTAGAASHGGLASYDPDKLLYHYRALAKLPQKAGIEKGYDGWDSEFLRGHMTGHYLSAASRMAAATGSLRFRDRVNYLVAELAACQKSLNQDGYLAAFSTAAFDQLEGKPGADAGGIGVPYYTIQKIMSGLLDAHAYVGNRQALDVATRMADYFGKRLARLDAGQVERIFRTDGSRNPQNEFGAMSDALTELYKIDKNPRHLDTARMFHRAWFVGPLAEGEDRLGGLHANTHIAQVVGLANSANVDGDPLEQKASENFWRLVVHRHAFANGGTSVNEWFDQPGVEAGPSIDSGKVLPPTTAETCNTHNMLKLTARLFERDRRAELADYYERALYNHVLASVVPDSGAMTYFTPFHGDFRTYLNGSYCCTGSGIENTARYNEGIYFHKDDALWVNLYIPSELGWRQAGIVLRQHGDITRRPGAPDGGEAMAGRRHDRPDAAGRVAAGAGHGRRLDGLPVPWPGLAGRRTWQAGHAGQRRGRQGCLAEDRGRAGSRYRRQVRQSRRLARAGPR